MCFILFLNTFGGVALDTLIKLGSMACGRCVCARCNLLFGKRCCNTVQICTFGIAIGPPCRTVRKVRGFGGRSEMPVGLRLSSL